MKEEQELLVMSVTRLSDGVCVACVDENNRWIRPTRQASSGWRQLEITDLQDHRGRYVVEVGNIVAWRLGSPAPKDVHSEDVFVGSHRPRLIRPLSPGEIALRCRQLLESDFDAFLRNEQRSLALLKPRAIQCVLFSAEGKEGVSSRIYLQHATGCENLRVRDLRWRAMARSILQRRRTRELRWTFDHLKRHAGLEILYVAVGKGRAFEGGPPHALAGRYWPIVVTVFTEPPNVHDIDYNRT